MLFRTLLPRLSRSYILLPLLFHQMNTGSTSRVSKHQLVSQFSAGSNATLLVKGDTVSGCKLVLLDRPRNKTCCYSAPERKETMCEPGIQSGGCRSRDTVKVEEHPGYCKTTFYNINQGDSGPYLVIFPGRVNDNEQFELNVEDDSEERTMSGLLPVSDISRYEEVMDFVPGTTATVSVPGNTGSGCKFLLLDQGRNLTCCFSSSSRGETLCHPDTQSIACRTKERYRVDELSDACIFILANIENTDAGPYKVIFPGRLSDNSKFDLTLRILAWDYSDLALLSGGGVATVIVVVVCFAIGFLCCTKNSRCHPAAINQMFSNGYEMDSVGDVSVHSSDNKSVARKNNPEQVTDADHSYTNQSYCEIG